MYFFLVVITVLTFCIIIVFHNSFLVTTPASGGTLTEGVIGAPSTINPILATTDTDIALTHLIYAGLMKESTSGEIIPELAESYTVSQNGLTYTFTLGTARFHDKVALTSSDVAFTISKLQNSTLNPIQTNYWTNITVEIPNTQTIVFILPSVRNDFLKHATIGIIPEHIWSSIDDASFTTNAQNTHPIGAGPFKFENIKSSNGVAQTITLSRNPYYILGTPLLKTLRIKIAANQSLLAAMVERGDVDFTTDLTAATVASAALPKNITVSSVPSSVQATLYRLRADPGSLSNSGLVSVLNQFIDKQEIVSIVEHRFGIAPDTATPLQTIEAAQTRLVSLGYKVQSSGALTKNGNLIGISIATTNDPDTVLLVQTIASQIRLLGVTVSIRSFDQGFFQNELAKNAFSVVLIKSGAPLSNSYEAVIPLYQTTIPFVVKNAAHGIIPSVLLSPPLRYADANHWYVKTDKLYPWLVRKD